MPTVWKVPRQVRLRQHYRSDGKEKRSFPSYHEGMNFLRRMNLASTKISYPCDVCGQWHVGRKQR